MSIQYFIAIHKTYYIYMSFRFVLNYRSVYKRIEFISLFYIFYLHTFYILSVRSYYIIKHCHLVVFVLWIFIKSSYLAQVTKSGLFQIPICVQKTMVLPSAHHQMLFNYQLYTFFSLHLGRSVLSPSPFQWCL